MSEYIRHKWKDDEIIDADKLNNIEQGIAEAGQKAGTHQQAADTITEGTLAGKVRANAASAADVGVSQVRNIYAGTADLLPGVSALETGALYFVYE